MAKGQKRSNREVRKPKKKKEPTTPPVLVAKGATVLTGIQKQKKT
jgi:hypothetical protein